MKKLLVLGVVVGALVAAGLIAYAAYDVTGSSSPEDFTAGTAADLAPDPDETDLTGILPGETRNVTVSVNNPNTVPVTVTSIDASVTPAVCAVTTTPWSGSVTLNGGATMSREIPATMGDPAAGCEGATLSVSATAVGTMP